jgi:hypothetical protein
MLTLPFPNVSLPIRVYNHVGREHQFESQSTFQLVGHNDNYVDDLCSNMRFPFAETDFLSRFLFYHGSDCFLVCLWLTCFPHAGIHPFMLYF